MPSFQSYDNLPSGQDTHRLHENLTPLWRPIWLKRVFLLALTILLVLLCATLGILWYFATKLDGFPLFLTSNHYTWTYGPTLVLVLVVAIWRQVDYCCKITQPWQSMSLTPTCASESVLLDYMWPLQITSFWKAVQNRHVAVVASIAVFVLLKITIVVSTALFTPLSVSVENKVNVSMQTEFDASGFWVALQQNAVYTMQPGIGVFAGISTDPIWWSIDLGYTASTNSTSPMQDSIAFTNFSVSDDFHADIYEAVATVEVFRPDIRCTPAEMTYTQANWTGTNVTIVTFYTSDCSGVAANSLCDAGTTSDSCQGAGSTFMLERINCTGDTSEAQFVPLNNETVNTYQYAVAAFEYSQQNTSLGDDSSTISRAAAVVCKIDYDIVPQPMTLNETSGSNTLSIGNQSAGGTTTKIPDFSDLQFSEALLSTLLAVEQSTGLNESGCDNMNGFALCYLMVEDNQVETRFESLLDHDLLRTSAENSLGRVGHQLMRRYFIRPDNTSEQGTINYMEVRLQIRAAAFWSILAMFILIIALSSTLTFIVEVNRAPESPATLATNMVILSQSPSLGGLMQGSGSMSIRSLRRKLSRHVFSFDSRGKAQVQVKTCQYPDKESVRSSSSQGTAKYEPLDKQQAELDAEAKSEPEWMPYSARRHAVCLTLLLPLLAIVGLELLWYCSEHYTGFVNVPDDSAPATYAIRYSSTVTALIIATLFNSLDFAIVTTTPYVLLRTGAVDPRRSILFSVAGDLPLLALFKCLRLGHYGALLSNVASSIGSFLTVTVSGLWIMNHSIQTTQTITGTIDSSWNINWTNSTDDGGAARLFNGIQHGRTEVSESIWQNVVLPGLDMMTKPIEPSASSTGQGSMRYEFPIQGIHPYLECEVVPHDALTVWRADVNYASVSFFPFITINATFELPSGCMAQSSPNSVYMKFQDNQDSDTAGNWTNWEGSLHYLDVIGSSSATSGCPSLGAIYGTWTGDLQNNNSFYNLTGVVCYQRLRQVRLDTTYDGTWSAPVLNSTNTSLLDQGNGLLLRNDHDGMDSLNFNAVNDLDNSLYMFDSSDGELFDVCFNHIIHGPDGVPPESLLGPENTDNLIAAINNFYQKYMVHVIDLKFRETPAPSDPRAEENELNPELWQHGQVVNGTATATVSRLKINETSKIILQVMLGVMTIVGGLAYWLTDLRGTLPRSPCSIASMMALFADSSLIFEGPEENSKNQKLSLGWWEEREREADMSGVEQEQEAMPEPEDHVDITDGGIPLVKLIRRKPVRKKWFGIDVGTPIMLGYSEKGAWRQKARKIGKKKSI